VDALCPDPDLVCGLVGKMVDPDQDQNQTCRTNPVGVVINLRPMHLPVRDLNQKRHAVPLLLPSPGSRKLDLHSSLVFVDLDKEHSHD